MGTVLSVLESWEGDEGGWQSPDGQTGNSTFTRKFTVVVDNTGGAVRAPQVLAHGDVPKRGDPHPWNFWFRCRGVSASKVSPTYYEVTATYTAETTESDSGTSPIDQPAEIEFNTITSEEEVDEDISGNPINNTNGEPIAGVKIPVGDLSATISKNLISFNPIAIYQFTNTVNAGNFMGFPRGVVRLASLRARIQYSEEVTYWTVTANFHFRYPVRTTAERSWWKRIRNEGYLVKLIDPFTGVLGDKLYHATDADGDKVTKPVMIDADGKQIEDASLAHWLEFQVFRYTDFNQLNLGV